LRCATHVRGGKTVGASKGERELPYTAQEIYVIEGNIMEGKKTPDRPEDARKEKLFQHRKGEPTLIKRERRR